MKAGNITSIIVFAGLTYFKIWGMMEWWQVILIGIGLIFTSIGIRKRDDKEKVRDEKKKSFDYRI